MKLNQKTEVENLFCDYQTYVILHILGKSMKQNMIYTQQYQIRRAKGEKYNKLTDVENTIN